MNLSDLYPASGLYDPNLQRSIWGPSSGLGNVPTTQTTQPASGASSQGFLSGLGTILRLLAMRRRQQQPQGPTTVNPMTGPAQYNPPTPFYS